MQTVGLIFWVMPWWLVAIWFEVFPFTYWQRFNSTDLSTHFPLILFFKSSIIKGLVCYKFQGSMISYLQTDMMNNKPEIQCWSELTWAVLDLSWVPPGAGNKRSHIQTDVIWFSSQNEVKPTENRAYLCGFLFSVILERKIKKYIIVFVWCLIKCIISKTMMFRQNSTNIF